MRQVENLPHSFGQVGDLSHEDEGLAVASANPATPPTCRRLRPGDLVEVRGRDEIAATLDSEGKIDGLPFMPEMARHCGRRYRVSRRADRVFLDHHYYVAQLNRAVFLEDVRCDGRYHGGCAMGCLLFWHEAWLQPVPADAPPAPTPDAPCGTEQRRLPVMQGERFTCQATELKSAGRRLRWWDYRQYLGEVLRGELPLRDFLRAAFLAVYNKLSGLLGRDRWGVVRGRAQRPTPGDLDLQPGELVEVKSREEIEALLDAGGRNRGLGFAPEMLKFCGKRFRVAHRVDQMIVEWSGQLRALGHTVALVGAHCDGLAYRACPRRCYLLWRECWLNRVAPPPPTPAEEPRQELSAV